MYDGRTALGYETFKLATQSASGEKLINLHLTDVTLTTYLNGDIVRGPDRMTFEAMTELIKPVVGSDEEFDKLVEVLMNEGRSSIAPKRRSTSNE